jgi:hypothetical protein
VVREYRLAVGGLRHDERGHAVEAPREPRREAGRHVLRDEDRGIEVARQGGHDLHERARSSRGRRDDDGGARAARRAPRPFRRGQPAG